MTNTLFLLCFAMATHEGWFPMQGGGINGNEPSLSYRNHNPGNLRKSQFAIGERGGFAVFENDIIGFMAMAWDIHAKARGNTVTGLNGESTIADLIKVWAPPIENDTEAYISHVELLTGMSRKTQLKTIIGK